VSLVLSRIDDRLIHGQVVVGWGQTLGIDFIVLVDDEVAASEWEQDLYRMAVPPEIEVVFAGTEAAGDRLSEWTARADRGMLLTGDIATMARLFAADGGAVHRINVGGLHHRPGRVQRLPYVFLTDDEAEQLRDLAAAGADVTAQDVPTTAPVPVQSFAG
jgi:PTS system mannose-specific IIB component/fructoselysine and glucoselysine-specific PTS system IIB component